MQEFIHSLSYLIRVFPNQVGSSRIEETNEPHDQVDFYQMHDLFACKCELSTPWLTNGTERICLMSKVVQQAGFY
jgi:hypothetical protein